jgi:hypothetical protein
LIDHRKALYVRGLQPKTVHLVSKREEEKQNDRRVFMRKMIKDTWLISLVWKEWVDDDGDDESGTFRGH